MPTIQGVGSFRTDRDRVRYLGGFLQAREPFPLSREAIDRTLRRTDVQYEDENDRYDLAHN